MFLLSLSEDGTVLSVGKVPDSDFTSAELPPTAVLTESIPDDAPGRYRYTGGTFVPISADAKE